MAPTLEAMFCEHANECPNICPCPANCYCKEHTCRCRTCGGLRSVPKSFEGFPFPAGWNHHSLPGERLAMWPEWHVPCPMCKPKVIQTGFVQTGPLRVAFCGASGTGKTTLSNYLVETLGLPFNPVGSRSVSKAMGFESPYDVDKAGKRAEFQRHLVVEKRAWEDEHESFVTDRTTLDNLAYTMLHDVYAVDASLLQQVVAGLRRYTHIIYCPVKVFCNPGGDPNRVADMTYHELYDAILVGLLLRYRPKDVLQQQHHTLHTADREARRAYMRVCLGLEELP